MPCRNRCSSAATTGARCEATLEKLQAAYYDLRLGLGFTKTPEVYGAFPTDPYSHSPRHRGAQQPGMTGQVKEEILTRFGELGIEIADGCLRFNPVQLRKSEFFNESHTFDYVDIAGKEISWELPAGTLAFTYCQTPIAYKLADKPSVTIERGGQGSETLDGNTLSRADSAAVFARTGAISRITVGVPRERLHP